MISSRASKQTPLQAAGDGALAGLAATILVSLLSRMTPLRMDDYASSKARREKTGGAKEKNLSAALTPGEILITAESAGPEGAAGKFAQKLASGLFGRDISPIIKPAGEAVNLAYGTFWGSVFGLIQASRPGHPLRKGLVFGAFLWGIGPGLLVPAMNLTAPPGRHPLRSSAALVLGHLIYGAALAGVYRQREKRYRKAGAWPRRRR